MDKKQLEELKLLKDAAYFQQIGNKAVKLAVERNKKNNIPSVFSMDGVIYYKMPDGKITRKSPFKENGKN